MRIRIDLDRCSMAGECVYNHPKLFEFGDDDYPHVLVASLHTPQLQLEAEQARSVCPSGAISIEP